jgi:fatty acid desaturase
MDVDIYTYLNKEEIKGLLKKNNWKAAWEVFDTWFWIAFAFAIAGIFPNVFTIIVALFILGGKQLACAIIMHDASHHALFQTRKQNEVIGSWFGAYPIFHDLIRYRPYHLKHHVTTGTTADPDLPLTKGYPTNKAGLTRKFSRDLTGLTGVKANIGLTAMHMGFLQYHLGGMIIKIDQKGRKVTDFFTTTFKNMWGAVTVNAIMLGILWLCGAPWLYLLWVGAYFTTYNFSLRVRSIAEHSIVVNSLDNHANSRTTYANFLERMLFAPHYVNYHAEHHLLMTVPPYNLRRMHSMIKERGFFEKGLLEPNYIRIVKLAASGKKRAEKHTH